MLTHELTKVPCTPNKTRICTFYKSCDCIRLRRWCVSAIYERKERVNLLNILLFLLQLLPLLLLLLPFFSIVDWHLPHSFVLADIQFAVSESSWHFFNHNFETSHGLGWWSWGNPQPKQNFWPHSQRTEGTIWRSCDFRTWHSIAFSQPLRSKR